MTNLGVVMVDLQNSRKKHVWYHSTLVL